jgi:TRAP-type mannitol/chloroaromatic compound transport system permease small subunit
MVMPSEHEPAQRPSRGYLAIIGAIDAITIYTGYVFTLLVIPLVVANVVEVFMRYVMNAPTSWALDVTTMSFGALFMLGAAYALLKGAHVRTDMLWEKYSERKKGAIDLGSYLLLFFPAMLVLFAISVDDAWYAFTIGETSEQSPWRPILWPFRASVPLAALLLMVQGVSEALKCCYQIRTGREFQHREKIEV